MNRVNLIFILLLGVSFSWGLPCLSLPLNPSMTRAEAVEQAKEAGGGGVVSRGIKDLTCFKCHIYERFLQEPAPGVFSHALHVQFDYHCNQCHSFCGHRRMVINTKICTFCHDTVPQLKKP